MKRTKFSSPDLGSIEITNCLADLTQCKNLTPGSIHKIVEPPKNLTSADPNWDSGVWVMGVSRPFKLLFSEFKKCKK